MRTQFTKSFAKDLRKHRKSQELLKEVLGVIETVEQAGDPTTLSNLKQLKAKGPYYRIRIGDYRIVITIEDDTVTFIRVLHRREIYRFFPDAPICRLEPIKQHILDNTTILDVNQ